MELDSDNDIDYFPYVDKSISNSIGNSDSDSDDSINRNRNRNTHNNSNGNNEAGFYASAVMGENGSESDSCVTCSEFVQQIAVVNILDSENTTIVLKMLLNELRR
eukprot:Pgem_evm1s13317